MWTVPCTPPPLQQHLRMDLHALSLHSWGFRIGDGCPAVPGAPNSVVGAGNGFVAVWPRIRFGVALYSQATRARMQHRRTGRRERCCMKCLPSLSISPPHPLQHTEVQRTVDFPSAVDNFHSTVAHHHHQRCQETHPRIRPPPHP